MQISTNIIKQFEKLGLRVIVVRGELVNIHDRENILFRIKIYDPEFPLEMAQRYCDKYFKHLYTRRLITRHNVRGRYNSRLTLYDVETILLELLAGSKRRMPRCEL